MIVEDERHKYLNYDKEIEEFEQDTRENVPHVIDGVRIRRAQSTINSIPEYMNFSRQMHSRCMHEELQSGLMEYIWRMR